MNTYMRYETVIFDMDGTLLYTLDDLTDVLNASLAAFGMPPRTLAEVKSFAGNGLRKLVEMGVPDGTGKDEADKVFGVFWKSYEKNCAKKTYAYDGMAGLLAELKAEGRRMAVVSNKSDPLVRELAEHFFPSLLGAAIGEQGTMRRKPAPDSVFEAMRRLHASPETSVYVGDSDTDMLTAKNSGLDCICVDWGYRSRAFLLENGAVRIASTPAQLKELLG